MVLITFLADLLEMLQIGISVEGGHILHGGHFGLHYPNKNSVDIEKCVRPRVCKALETAANSLNKKRQLPASGSSEPKS